MDLRQLIYSKCFGNDTQMRLLDIAGSSTWLEDLVGANEDELADEVINLIEAARNKAFNIIDNTETYKYKGTVSKLLGLTVEAKLPGLKIGDLCYIETVDGDKKPAEVVAFKGDVAQMLLLYDGTGIAQGSLVTSTNQPILFPVGDFLLGRLVNPLGIPLDGKPLDTSNARFVPVDNDPPACSLWLFK